MYLYIDKFVVWVQIERFENSNHVAIQRERNKTKKNTKTMEKL